MLKSGKYICIKKLNSLLQFKIGEEYNIDIEYYSDFMVDYITIGLKNDCYSICNRETDIEKVEQRFNLFFISLADWRQKQIDSIIEYESEKEQLI